MGRRWTDNFAVLTVEHVRLWLIRCWNWHVNVVQLISQEPGVLFLFVVLPLTIVSLLIMNSRITANTEVIAKLREDLAYHIAQERTEKDIAHQSLADRISNLERVVFVDVKAAIDKSHKSPPPGSNLWQRQRDAELRERLLALERWRLQQER